MKQFFFLLLVMRTFAFSYSSVEVFKEFPNKVFGETGTFCGDGIQLALNSNRFENIASIELSKEYYFLAKNKFINQKSVKLVLGDSSKVLANVIKNIHVPITFWLDGHYSGGNTAKAEKY